MNRLERWRRPLLSFVVGQPATQVIGFVTGFILLRWLSVESYAQYSIAFAFQSLICQLADLGFSSSVMAMAGTESQDKQILGKFLKAARYLRLRLMFMVLPVGLAVFPLLTSQHMWSIQVTISLIVAIALSVTAQGLTVYGTPLLVHRQLTKYFGAQIAVSLGRLGAIIAFHTSGLLSAVVCTWIGAMALATNGYLFRKSARNYVAEPLFADPRAVAEMKKYLAPLVPIIVFTAFQGQISIAIITIFGTTKGIAEVAALGRIGQLFLIFGAINSLLIAPYISTLLPRLLLRRYIQIIVASIFLVAFIGIGGFINPDLIIKLLGEKYKTLTELVPYIIFTGCAAHLSGVFWTMNSCRKWIYWWSTVLEIAMIIGVQIGCIIFLDLSNTKGAVIFGLLTSVAILVSHIITAIYGLRKMLKTRSMLATL